MKFNLVKPILFFLFIFCSMSNDTCAHNNKSFFVENKGQWNKNVTYKYNVDGGSVWFEKNCFTYFIFDKDALAKNHVIKENESYLPIKSHAFKMHFKNSNNIGDIKITANNKAKYYENYFVGNLNDEWKGKVNCFENISYNNLYKGIDMLVESNKNSFKYTFYVHPNKAEQLPVLVFDSIRKLKLENGNLIITTSFNTIVEQKPIAYQIIKKQKIAIACNFSLQENIVSFEFPEGYDKNFELVIDPTLIFSTYSGSTSDNFGMSASYDNSGNLIAGGIAFNQGYPTTLGALDTTYNGSPQNGRTDVVITKYNNNGSSLLFSTYLGGTTGTEIVSSIIVDSLDNVYILGTTGSSDFPVTNNAFDVSFNGGTPDSLNNNGTKFLNGTDIFISKLNANGTQLLASTYIGGSANDGINRSNVLSYNYGDFYRGEIQNNKQGNVVVTSCTYSNNFPTSSNTIQINNAGGLDAIAFSIDNSLQNLLWSTYIGGVNDDAGYALAIDNSNNTIITGGTASNNFPTTNNVLNATYIGGVSDGFVTKINSTGTVILNSTFIGTQFYDQCYFVQTDILNNIYCMGQSLGNMPVVNVQYSNPNSKNFIIKLNPSLNTNIYSTVFGNGTNVSLCPTAFLVDICQNVYVSGWGGNILTGVALNNMPITTDAQQTTTDGFNFYIAVFDANITNLKYASYFGGSQSWEHADGGTSRFDKNGIIYQSVCAGCGAQSDFPTTPNVWSSTNNSSNCNNAVFKLDIQPPPAIANFSTNTIACEPYTFTPQNLSSINAKQYWSLNGVLIDSVNFEPTITIQNSGTYLLKLKVYNELCQFYDSISKTIIVHPKPNADFNYEPITCSTKVLFKDSSFSNATPLTYQWNFGDNTFSNLQNPTHEFGSVGNFNVQLIAIDNNTCRDTLALPVTIDTVYNFKVNNDIAICTKGQTVSLKASGGTIYIWEPKNLVSDALIANPTTSIDTTTVFKVLIGLLTINGDTCSKTLQTKVIVSNILNDASNISANPDTIFVGEKTNLNLNSLNTTFYEWQPAETLDNNKIKNPTAKPNKDTWYEVNAKDNLGCNFTKKVFVKVLSNSCNEPNIFVPNSFTPNADNINDILYVNGNFIETLHFKIYNRWGELVFESNNIATGWDGKIKGSYADLGVYGYIVNATCKDGKTFFKKGNITLIK